MNNRILVVDDDPMAREELKTVLEGESCYLDLASSGPAALEKALSIPPDLILLDVMMPGMSGFEVCRQIRANPIIEEVPIVILTSLNDKESYLRGFEAGADDFLTKPFNHHELHARVRSILRLNRYRRLLEGRALIRELTNKVITAHEEERRHIAQEIHDELGQSLTMIGIGLNLLTDDLVETQESARTRIADMQSILQKTISRMRLLGQDLRPPALDMVGLAPALEGHCREFSQRTGLPVLFRASPEIPSLSEACNIALYRFLQETLTNAVRYSGASQVWVKLSADKDSCVLSVRDDGKGFPQPVHGELTDPIKRQDGSSALGLWGLQERLETFFGRLEINSKPGEGAVVTAWLPFRT
ncbi:MAG: response regulator [Chloroflexi bacterium]|nr:MAG: response regulator [Chloroflexota bacterium]